MVHVPVRLVPSVLVAHMFAVPAATAVTNPDEFTVAMPVLLDDQVNVLFVAFDGRMVEFTCVVAPGASTAELGTTVILVIRMAFADTDTETVADRFDPSVVCTVMVAEPADTEVINPELETVAIPVLLDDQDSVLLAALEGATVAVICCVCEMVMETDVGVTVRLETRIGALAVAR